LAERYNAQGNVSVKEHELATAVFGRDAAFDSRLDSIVRVQTGRLRAKLAEYYMSEGEHDQVLLEIPKGAYCLVARSRTVAAVTPAANTDVPVRSRRIFNRWAAAAIALAACVGLAAFLLTSRADNQGALRRFWKDMVDSPGGPILIFTNPTFSGSSTTGLHIAEPGKLDRESMNDTYTGTGEVIGVYELTKLFAALHGSFRLKRSGLLTWDDAKDHDLIFLGAPVQNLPLGEVRLRQFRFESRDGRTVIVNVKPQAKEQQEYAPPQERPLHSDYAIVARIWSPVASRHVLVLAGTTTYGTQAAAEFVCRKESVERLLERLGSSRGAIPEFEALIGVTVTGGAAVQSELLAVHGYKRD
jgi:hypothetical protein